MQTLLVTSVFLLQRRRNVYKSGMVPLAHSVFPYSLPAHLFQFSSHFPFTSTLFSFPPLLRDPPLNQLERLMSAVSSPAGVWGEASADKQFNTFELNGQL